MLPNMRFRTKLMLIVAVPMVAALVVAVPGLRTRVRDLRATARAQSQTGPAATVRSFLDRIDDEGSLSAWWVASGEPTVRTRLRAARRATDRAARPLAAPSSRPTTPARRSPPAGSTTCARRSPSSARSGSSSICG